MIDRQFLDNMNIGEEYWATGDEKVTKLSDGVFQYESRSNGYTRTGGATSIIGMINQSSASAQSINSIFGGLGSIAYPSRGPSITASEKARLEDLEKELVVHIKTSKLNAFKALPKDLRQEIVDEGLLRDCLISMNSNHEGSFPDAAELSSLRNKNQNHYNGYNSIHPGLGGLNHAMGLGSFGHDYHVSIGGKYGQILAQFKTEELIKAHAEAALEEAIE